MNIATLAANAVRTGMVFADSVRESVTFHLGGVGPEDGDRVDVDLRTLPYKRENAQVGAEMQNESLGSVNISLFTEKLLVSAEDLGGREILETDSVTRADGIVWEIVSAKSDPSRSLWIVEVRR